MDEFIKKYPPPYKILAPMVDYSDQGWRILARKYGATLCYTEMVHAEIFLATNANPINNRWFTTSPIDRPLVIQICGNCPEKILKVAQKLEDHCDAIDINFGCPQNIAKRGNYGCFLQDEWDKIGKIVSNVSKNIKVPLFCKIRVFDDVEKTVEYAKMFERCGCALLSVHGRTREQKSQNSGFASWYQIKRVKAALKIPVISNGNVVESGDIEKCLLYTNCDGVMVAETHIYNPLIFSKEYKTNVDIFREYYNICKDLNIVDFSHLRNHAFKLFHGFLCCFEDFRKVLGETSDFLGFVKLVENKISENGKPELLEMRPYLRAKRKIDVESFML